MHLVEHFMIFLEFPMKLHFVMGQIWLQQFRAKIIFNILIHQLLVPTRIAYQHIEIIIFFLLARYDADMNTNIQVNPLLPKITMVGISMGEGGQMSKANLKKTMEDLTRELEQTSEKNTFGDEKDPLFVANVGDYSRITKISSTWGSLTNRRSILYILKL